MSFSFWEKISFALWPSEEQTKFELFRKISTNPNYTKEEFEKLDFINNIDIIKKWCLKLNNSNPIHQALLCGNYRLANFLLDQKDKFNINIHDLDDENRSVLHYLALSIINNYFDSLKIKKSWLMLERLIVDGVDREIRDKNKLTAWNLLKNVDILLFYIYQNCERSAIKKISRSKKISKNYLKEDKEFLNSRLRKIEEANTSSRLLLLEQNEIFPIDDIQYRRNKCQEEFDLNKLLQDETIEQENATALKLIFSSTENFDEIWNETFDQKLVDNELNEEEILSNSL